MLQRRIGQILYTSLLVFSLILFLRVPVEAELYERDFAKNGEIMIGGNDSELLRIVWQAMRLILFGKRDGPIPMEKVSRAIPFSFVYNRVIDWTKKSLPRMPNDPFVGTEVSSSLENLEDQFKSEIAKATNKDLIIVFGALNDLTELIREKTLLLEKEQDKYDVRVYQLEWGLSDLKTTIEQEIESRKKMDELQIENIENFRNEVLEIIPQALIIIPELEEALDRADSSIQEMETVMHSVRSIKEELEEESRRTLELQQSKRIEDLEMLINNLTEEIEGMQQAIEMISEEEIEVLERRKITFGVAVGLWLPASTERQVTVYEAQLILNAIQLFGGGGGDPSISYYGLKYSFGGIMSIGVGGLNSNTAEQTKLMLHGGLRFGKDWISLLIDYFYVPQEGESGGTRVCLSLRF